jgi:hypothetical protein
MDSNARNTGNRLIGARWTDEELKKYYKYFHKYKRDCTKVSRAHHAVLVSRTLSCLAGSTASAPVDECPLSHRSPKHLMAAD